MIKAILALLLFLSASPSNRIESTNAYFDGRAVHYYTAYSNGECVADDVASLETLAEILTAEME